MLLNPYRFGLPVAVSSVDLISYWRMDEASGNAVDSHGTNHLTDVNAVGSAVGKSARARDFERDSTQYFSIASNASLQLGDIPYTYTLWVKLESVATTQVLLSKDNGVNQREILCQHNANAAITWGIFNGGTVTGSAAAPSNTVAGVWYFVALWHDPTVDKVYLQINNGTVVEGATSTQGGMVTVEPFMIGAFNFPSNRAPFDGLIDEVGFWKRVLTPAERAALYNSGNALPYPFDGSVVTLPPVAAFSGTPLTGTFPLSVTFTDSSAYVPTSWAWAKNSGSGWVPFAGTPTAQNPTEIFAAGVWSVRLTATNATGSDDEVKTNYVTPPLMASLVSYWRMDEASGNALDAHGTNHLTVTGAVGSAAGKVGTARDFERDSTQYFSRLGDGSLVTGDINFTFACWVRPESSGVNMAIFSKWQWTSGAGKLEFVLYYQTDTGFQFYVNSTTVQVFVKSGTSNPAGNWYHIVCWHDAVNNQIGLTVNNGTPFLTANANGVTPSATSLFQFGADDTALDRMDGLIDEVGFWKRVLTPTERAELYNSGNGKTYPFT